MTNIVKEVWVLVTVDAGEIQISVHYTEAEALEALREQYARELDVTENLIEYVTEQGVLLALQREDI